MRSYDSVNHLYDYRPNWTPLGPVTFNMFKILITWMSPDDLGCFILGGWLLVSNVEFGSPSPKVSVETSYRGIGKSHMVLQKSAMKELRRHLSFTQLRFHCRKKQGRTFHVVTASNSSGEGVVRYFSGQTDEQPVRL